MSVVLWFVLRTNNLNHSPLLRFFASGLLIHSSSNMSRLSFNSHLHDLIISHGGEVWVHKTSKPCHFLLKCLCLARKESCLTYTCLLGISIYPGFIILFSRFWNCFDGVNLILIFFYFITLLSPCFFNLNKISLLKSLNTIDLSSSNFLASTSMVDRLAPSCLQ